jgi:hypothetical protein
MFTYFVWLVSSLAFGTIGAWLFARKGRSPFLGFILGVALNVFALAVWQQYYNGKKRRVM